DAVAPARGFYGLAAEDVLVVSDEVQLPLGSVRFREHGGAGGHNGLKSVIAALGTQDFARIRIGIGTERMDTVPMDAFVLERFSDAELAVLAGAITDACDMLDNLLADTPE